MIRISLLALSLGILLASRNSAAAQQKPIKILFLGDKGHPELATSPTKMTFLLVDPQQRKDVIAYLKTFSKP